MTRVLIAYDGSDPARAAVAAAGALFGGADAIVATVYPPPPSIEAGRLARPALPDAMIREGIERMREQAEEKAQGIAQEGAQLAADAGLKATPAIHAGVSAWRALREAAAAADADVVAAGTRGQGPLSRLFLGCTASSLLHHADRPLLLAPTGEVRTDGPLLAGFDDSDGARDALRFAAAHVRGRPLIVAHAWRSPVRHTLRGQVLAGSGVELLEEYADGIHEVYASEAAAVAEDGAAFARELGLDARSLALESGEDEWRTLLSGAADEGAAAILVGTRGRGAVAATVLGSVASGLVHAATLPVLVVPGA